MSASLISNEFPNRFPAPSNLEASICQARAGVESSRSNDTADKLSRVRLNGSALSVYCSLQLSHQSNSVRKTLSNSDER